jgi:hypothetical protein
MSMVPHCTTCLIFFSYEFLSPVLQPWHFPDRCRDLFDNVKLNQAHILELGCVVWGLQYPMLQLMSYFCREGVRDFSHSH